MPIRHLVIILFFMFSVGGLHAQGGSRFLLSGKNIRHVKPEQLTTLLQKRAHETWLQTRAAAALHTRQPNQWPTPQMSAPLHTNPYRHPSPAALLTAPEQWTYYFLTKNNLEIRKWLTRLEQTQQFITQHLQELRDAQVPVTHPAQEDATWLAHQIPDQTRYLLLGEWHNQPAIQHFVSDFLHSLHKTEKEIILFTEFISYGQSWEIPADDDPFLSYLPIWLTASALHIPVVGLEPKFVYENGEHALVAPETGFLPPELQIRQSLWASIEGIRLRNTFWKHVLETYRQEHPDALFVVLAGADHVSYTQPYSLGSSLPQPNTFTVLLPPREYQTPDGSSRPFTWQFDALTNGQFNQRVVYFDDRQLARRAGFDIQVKIPTSAP